MFHQTNVEEVRKGRGLKKAAIGSSVDDRVLILCSFPSFTGRMALFSELFFSLKTRNVISMEYVSQGHMEHFY